jgi:hypothetical protein
VTDWKTSLKAAAVGAIAGTAIGLAGFLFLTSRQGHSMGGTLFLLVPFVAGFAVAMVARQPKSAVVAACLLSVVGSLILLIALGKEGVLCGILALPIIVTGLAVGAVIGFLVRKLFMRDWSQTTTMGIVVLIAPTVIAAGERIERPMLLHPRTEVIQTTVDVDDSPEKVWARILVIDTVQANKPLLMYIGLPVPQRCTLQGRGVGAKRTCYFNVGYIDETVTEWNPPYYLRLSVDRTHMPGRHWLGFENAQYRLQPNGPNTRLTRTTTVLSDLHPAWYWRYFERLGVESEHNYILSDIMLRSQR